MESLFFWVLTGLGLLSTNATMYPLPQSFPPQGALAHHRAAVALETSTGVGRRVRWQVKMFQAGERPRIYALGKTRPTAPPVFDARDRVAYAVGDEIRWLDGRIRRVPGLPRGATIVLLEFAPRGGSFAATAVWGESRYVQGNEAIFVVSPQRTRMVAAGFAPWAEEPDAVWSPDGKWIAYARQASGQPSAVEAVRAIGGRTVRVSLVKRAFGPVWSPDGNSIAFTASTYYSASAVYIRRLNGSERRLTRAALFRTAEAFSPDGKLLALASGNALALVPVAGGKMKILARDHNVQSARGPIYWPRTK